MSLMIAIAARGGEPVDASLETGAQPQVRIENTRGELDVQGWSENRVTVSGELDDLADEWVFESNGSEVVISVRTPVSSLRWGDGSDLAVRVPHGSRVRFDGVSTDVSLTGVTGGVRVRSVSGDVALADLGSDLEVRTVSGDVEVAGASGRVNVVTTSGDLKLELQASNVTVDTVSGEVELELGDFDRLQAKSINGELEISGRLGDAGHLTAETVNGDIEVRLIEPVDAHIRVRTGPGGEIENRLTDDRPAEAPARQTLEAVIGTGSGVVELMSVNGDVILEGG